MAMTIDTKVARYSPFTPPPSLSAVPSLAGGSTYSPSLGSSSPVSSPQSSPIPYKTIPAPAPCSIDDYNEDDEEKPAYFSLAKEKPSTSHLCGYPLHPVFTLRYRLVREELGCGGFGFVLAAERRSDGKQVAVKFIYRAKIPQHGWAVHPVYGEVPTEIYILSQVSHRNVVRMVEHFADRHFFYLVTELHGSPWSLTPPPSAQHPQTENLEGAMKRVPMLRRASHDLFECIESHASFSEATTRHIMRQVVEAVAYLAHHNIAHRDIKDENILIDENFSIRLCDFGSAVVGRQVAHDTFFGITVNFAAPECFSRSPYCAKTADVWSLGVLLYTCLFGSTPFANPQAICSKAWKISSRRPRLSNECYHVLQILLEKDPTKRATMVDVANAPWWTCDL